MKLNRGINLGGFLSQCCHEEQHYQTFILEEDLKQIAAWGFDHVRLPIDYEVLETEEGETKESGFEKVEEVVRWCDKYEMNLILDLHKAFGYDFNMAGDKEKNSLFQDAKTQERFLTLWEKIAKRFGKESHVVFELLNEVVEQENAEAWNQLIQRTVNVIRRHTKTTPIIYGGIQWNSVKTLKLLEKPQDENIIFTFHFYEPLLFTHQKAYWVKNMDPDATIHYPETMEYYRTKSKVLGVQGEVAAQASAKTMGPEFIQEMIEEAILAAEQAGVSLYCGEFGVIDQAPVKDTLKWFEDVDAVFRKYEIGCAVWSYKEMDFGLTEEHYKEIKDALINLWCKE